MFKKLPISGFNDESDVGRFVNSETVYVLCLYNAVKTRSMCHQIEFKSSRSCQACDDVEITAEDVCNLQVKPEHVRMQFEFLISMVRNAAITNSDQLDYNTWHLSPEAASPQLTMSMNLISSLSSELNGSYHTNPIT
jgi:hypothetical protein